MEKFLVSASTGALKSVLGKLADLLGDEYKRFKGVRKEITFLTDELTHMHAFLLNMSEVENPDVQDKVWMNEVRELSYDMEGSIDEFMLRVDAEPPDGFTEKIKNTFAKMKTRHRIAKAIEDFKRQVIVVGERHARYNIGEDISKTRNVVKVDCRAMVMFEEASKLVGIDGPKDEIVKLLTQDSGRGSSQQHPKVVSIFGSAGLGKTTLANQVYQELQGEFLCRAFISVSRNPDMMTILRTILSQVSQQSYTDTEAGDAQQVISNIRQFLHDKRYFIVVDDVWEVEIWDTIKCAFPKTSCGSMIITTTRINDVAQSCRSSFGAHIYNIRPLNIVNSRKLFYRRLFNSEEKCPSHLEEVSDQILEKCDGLPLAIIAIAGLLANKKRTKDQWDQVKNSIGCALERNPSVEGMMKVLSLSYFDLPHHLKTCLLYLSIFPEDYNIRKDDLIKRWIAEGFFYQESGYTAQELGERCFNELINRSLIQPWETDLYYEVSSCQVHDIVLEFIVSKAIEENFVTLVGVPGVTTVTKGKVRRLSVQAGQQGDFIQSTSCMVLSNVRSIDVFGEETQVPSLVEFPLLRVLNLQCPGSHYSLANIGGLFQLRYLNLTGYHIHELPEQIGYLQHLETIDIRDTYVHRLPKSFVGLKKMAHLYTSTELEFPEGIVSMQALETLDTVRLNRQSLRGSTFLQELGELKNLRKLVLQFDNSHDLELDEIGMKAVASSLYKHCARNLHSLTIEDDDLRGDGFLLEPWCLALLSLRELNIVGQPITRVPDWVGSAVNLQQIVLRVMKIRQEDLSVFGGLPSLLVLALDINGIAKPEDRLTVGGADGFQCLTNFYYSVEDGLNLMFAEGSMPKLEKLQIGFNAAKTESLTGGCFNFGMENLTCLSNVHYWAWPKGGEQERWVQS
ncbi:unnamed protein product [Alopecurus aequalis]